MASKYGYTMKTLTGMATYEMSKLTADQARDLRNVANAAMNKRYTRIREQNYHDISASYRQAMNASGVEKPHFSTPRGATRNENLRALTRLATLAKQSTGTLTGTKKYVERVAIGLAGGAEAVSGKKLTGAERKQLIATGKEILEQRKNDPAFWRAVRGVINNAWGTAFDSMDALKRVNEMMVGDPGADPSAIIVRAVREQQDKLYPDEDGNPDEWDRELDEMIEADNENNGWWKM